MTTLVIWSIVALLLMVIGVASWKAKKAVGFLAFKPPMVNDVKGYNRSIAILWIVAAILSELMGITVLYAGQDIHLFVSIMFSVTALMLLMVVIYIMIETKYKA